MYGDNVQVVEATFAWLFFWFLWGVMAILVCVLILYVLGDEESKPKIKFFIRHPILAIKDYITNLIEEDNPEL
jgi:hypothetical protein